MNIQCCYKTNKNWNNNLSRIHGGMRNAKMTFISYNVEAAVCVRHVNKSFS